MFHVFVETEVGSFDGIKWEFRSKLVWDDS